MTQLFRNDRMERGKELSRQPSPMNTQQQPVGSIGLSPFARNKSGGAKDAVSGSLEWQHPNDRVKRCRTASGWGCAETDCPIVWIRLPGRPSCRDIADVTSKHPMLLLQRNSPGPSIGQKMPQEQMTHGTPCKKTEVFMPELLVDLHAAGDSLCVHPTCWSLHYLHLLRHDQRGTWVQKEIDKKQKSSTASQIWSTLKINERPRLEPPVDTAVH